MTQFKPKTRKYNIGWVGYVECWENDQKLWSQSCEILRPHKQNALNDAVVTINRQDFKPKFY